MLIYSFFQKHLDIYAKHNAEQGDNAKTVIIEDIPAQFVRTLVRYLYSDELDMSTIPHNKRLEFVKCVRKLAPEHANRICQLIQGDFVPEGRLGYAVISIISNDPSISHNKPPYNNTWAAKIWRGSRGTYCSMMWCLWWVKVRIQNE